MQSVLPRLALGLTLLLSSLIARADTVWLDNGDQLSGNIIMLDSGTLLLQTTHAGTVRIDSSKIKTLHSEQKMRIRIERFGATIIDRLQPGDDGYVSLASQPQQQILIKDLHQALAERKTSLQRNLVWSGNITLGADFKRRDSDSDDYDLDIDTRLRYGLWRHGLKLEYDYETKDGDTKTDKLAAGYAIDRFFSERWFWKGKYEYDKARLEDLYRQTSYATGAGFQFWANELGAVAGALLYTHSQLYYHSDGKQSVNSSSLLLDYRRFIFAKTLELFGKGEFNLPASGDANYMIDAEAGLRYRLNSWANLRLRVEWYRISNYQNENLNDRRYLLGVGVNW